MASSIWGSAGALGALLLLAASRPSFVHADVPLDLCSSFNTASMDKNISIYQTNGLCSDFCRSDFAFSITQYQSCWCSNYAPAKSAKVDMDKCDTTCPAYPPEMCGGKGVYGYVKLNGVQPSGTKGASSSTSTSDDSSSTSEVQTYTSDGTVRTVTIVPTEPAESGNNGGSSNDDGLGTGAIVGIVVGVVGAILIAAGALFFWFYRRRKRNQQDGYQGDPSVRGNSSDRMGSAHPEMSTSPGSNMGSNRNSTLAIDPRMDPFKQGLYMRNGSRESDDSLRDDHDYSRRIQQPKVLRATNPDPDNAE